MSSLNESIDQTIGGRMHMEPIEGLSAEVEGIDNKKAGAAWHKMDALIKNKDVKVKDVIVQGNRNVFYCIKDYVSGHYEEEIGGGLLPEPKPHYAVSLEREGHFTISFTLIKEKKGRFKVMDVGDNVRELSPLAAGEINAFLDEIASGVRCEDSNEPKKVITEMQTKVEDIYAGQHLKVEMITDYATENLSPEKASEVKSHIDDCDECREAFDAVLTALAEDREWGQNN